MMRTYSVAFFLLCSTPHALAYSGNGCNPGDWRASPTQLATKVEQHDLEIQLVLFNADEFAKFCTLELSLNTQKLGYIPKLLLAAQTFTQASLILPNSSSMASENKSYQAVCIAPDIGETLTKLPDPADLDCQRGGHPSDQLCEADAKNPSQCRNDHLVFAFASTFNIDNRAQNIQLTRTLTNSSTRPLFCQFLATAQAAIPGSSSSSVIIRSTLGVSLAAGESYDAQFAFRNSDAGLGQILDLSHSQLYAVCLESPPRVPSAFWMKCNPLKRPECNWARSVD